MSNEKEAKLKALQLTLDKLDKAYGKGTVMKMGDNVTENIEAISSGSIGLDVALGVGGYPRGRVVEIYGPESSGKTTLTLHAIAECQKIGGIAAFIDAEHAFDRYYAKNLGVQIDDLIISQPDVDTFRDSLPIIEKDLSEHKSNKNLVMYCTGGIRCEKASAYFKHKGFERVYQLEGGIIEYARQVKNQGLDNKFIGKNFVFDERRSEAISDDVIATCHQCGSPCDTHVNCANDGCHLLFIQCPSCAKKHDNCCSDSCAAVVALPEDKQRALRKGTHNSNKIFKKGRAHHLKTLNPS